MRHLVSVSQTSCTGCLTVCKQLIRSIGAVSVQEIINNKWQLLVWMIFCMSGLWLAWMYCWAVSDPAQPAQMLPVNVPCSVLCYEHDACHVTSWIAFHSGVPVQSLVACLLNPWLIYHIIFNCVFPAVQSQKSLCFMPPMHPRSSNKQHLKL